MKSALTTISALVFGFFMLAACGNSEPPPDAGTDWTLVGEESRIAFVSIKAAEVAETHSFTGLTGSITTEGAATLAIDLNSVNTRIDIRDERMRELFFETSVFPRQASPPRWISPPYRSWKSQSVSPRPSISS